MIHVESRQGRSAGGASVQGGGCSVRIPRGKDHIADGGKMDRNEH